MDEHRFGYVITYLINITWKSLSNGDFFEQREHRFIYCDIYLTTPLLCLSTRDTSAVVIVVFLKEILKFLKTVSACILRCKFYITAWLYNACPWVCYSNSSWYFWKYAFSLKCGFWVVGTVALCAKVFIEGMSHSRTPMQRNSPVIPMMGDYF